MNLAIHGIDGQIAHPPLAPRAAQGLQGASAYAAPPTGKAHYTRVQHFIHHMAPTGRAGFGSRVGKECLRWEVRHDR